MHFRLVLLRLGLKVLCVSGINLLPFYCILLVFWLVKISLVLDTNNAVASRGVSKMPSCSTASGLRLISIPSL